MVKGVIDNLPFLKALVRASRYKRRTLLSLARTKQLLCLKEICRNLKGNIPMPDEVLEKLTKGGYKPYIRLCGDKNTNLHTTRSTLVKRGGFLPFVIPAIIRFAQNYMMTAPNKRHRLFKHSDQKEYSSMSEDEDLESSDTQSNMNNMDDESNESNRNSSESDNDEEESNMDTGEVDESDESSGNSSESNKKGYESDESSNTTWNKLEKTGRRTTTRKKNMSSINTGVSSLPYNYAYGNPRPSNYRPDVDPEEVDRYVKFLTRQFR